MSNAFLLHIQHAFVFYCNILYGSQEHISAALGKVDPGQSLIKHKQTAVVQTSTSKHNISILQYTKGAWWKRWQKGRISK